MEALIVDILAKAIESNEKVKNSMITCIDKADRNFFLTQCKRIDFAIWTLISAIADGAVYYFIK